MRSISSPARGPTTATPYFVQQDRRSYSYSNGRVSHEYDEHGRPQAPNAQHQSEARQFADHARQQHDRAQQASKTAPHIDRSRDNNGRRQETNPAPSRTPPTNGTSDASDNRRTNTTSRATDGKDRGSARARPTDHGASDSTPSDRTDTDRQHAVHGRMAIVKASTGRCVMSCSMVRSSTRSPRPGS